MKHDKTAKFTPPPPRKGDYIGYARVSTQEQILDLQLDALKKAGCVNIYEEKASAGGKTKRPQLDLAIKELQPGDTLVVWRLDRLARGMDEFYTRMRAIRGAGAEFKSLTENFDFTTAMGEFVLIILAAVAQLERQLTQYRTKAGLDVARAKGKKLGAEAKINDAMKLRIQKKAALEGKAKMTLQAIADGEDIALSSIFNVFKGGRKAIAKWRPVKKPVAK
jgi:DNA invertase Pin-like site-specific DNA recombinase